MNNRLCICSLAACFVSGCLSVTHTLNSACYDKPPYRAIALRAPMLSGQDPTNWPALASGEAIVLFSCGPTCDIHRAAPEALSISVESPAVEHVAHYATASAKIVLPCSTISVLRAESHGEVEMRYALRNVHVMVETGRAAIVSAEIISSSLSRDAALSTLEATDSVTAVFAQDTLDTSTQSVSIAVEHASAKVESRGAAVSVDHWNARSYLASLKDIQELSLVTDSQILEMLEEQHLLEGFYDSQELVLLTDAVTIPQSEYAAILNMLNIQDIRSLICRDIDRPFTGALTGKCKVSVYFTAVFPARAHHGQEILVALSVRNDGQHEITGATMMMRIPDQSAFSRFPVPLTEQGGYLRFCLDDDTLLVWRLYRPLPPGHAFHANFILRTAPWTISRN